MNDLTQCLVHSKWTAVTVTINNNKARTLFSQSRIPSSQAKKLASGPFCRVGLQEEAQLSRKLREQDNGRASRPCQPQALPGMEAPFRRAGPGLTPKTASVSLCRHWSHHLAQASPTEAWGTLPRTHVLPQGLRLSPRR